MLCSIVGIIYNIYLIIRTICTLLNCNSLCYNSFQKVVIIMPITDAKRRANAKWDKDNMTVLGCKVRKDKADKFKAMCKNAGTTPNAIFTAAMDLFMAEHDQASPMHEAW